METIFEKLSRSPWEERFASFCGFLLKVVFVGTIFWALLNLDMLIPIIMTPSVGQ